MQNFLPQVHWSIVLREISIIFRQSPKRIHDMTDKSKHGGSWFPGSVLNIAECCLLPAYFPKKTDESVAVVWREEWDDDRPVNSLSLKELREQVMYV